MRVRRVRDEGEESGMSIDFSQVLGCMMFVFAIGSSCLLVALTCILTPPRSLLLSTGYFYSIYFILFYVFFFCWIDLFIYSSLFFFFFFFF